MKKEVKQIRATIKSSSAKRKQAEHEDFLTAPTHLRRPQAKKMEKGSLGERIRKVRESHGLTLKDISSRTGIDVGALKLMESGEMAPPLGQLIKLGKALDMKMGYFISPGVDKPMTVVRKDQRQTVSRHAEKKGAQYGYLYESLAPEKANRAMEPFIVTLLPTEAEEFSSHDGQEFIFVLDGEVKVQVGSQAEFLHSGDAVYYDSKQPHLVKAVGEKKTRILAVIYAESK
jgi:transcriptional regulator with XRE-family HTH domain